MKQCVRLKIVSVFLVCVFMLTIFATISKSGVLPINSKDSAAVESYRKDAEDEIRLNTVVCGNFSDCNDEIIQENTEPQENGYVPDEYAYIVGYSSDNYGSFGLHNSQFDVLYDDAGNGKGKSIKLTTDNGLQYLCSELLKGTDGSAVVIERHSGKVRALVSTDKNTVFSVNDLSDSKMAEYNNIEGIWLPKYNISEQPGSVAKLFSCACILESGNEDFTYNDETGIIVYDEGSVKNCDSEILGFLDLEKAVVKSSNVYFAMASMQVDRATIQAMMKKFIFNEDIICDFGTVRTGYDLGTYRYDRASAFYGQGMTLFSTVSLALMTQGVCDGVIYKPHIIDSVYDETESSVKVFSETEEEVLSEEVVSDDTITTLDNILREASESYGIPSEMNIRAKTGTADLVNNTQKATICSYNDDYIVVISETNTDKYGYKLTDKLIQIYDYLT